MPTDDPTPDAERDAAAVPPPRLARPPDADRVIELQSLLSAPSPGMLRVALADLAGRSADRPSVASRVSSASVSDPDPGSESPRTYDGTSDRPTLLLVSPGPTGRPAGYLLALRGGEETHIAELAVAPSFRREGRATALVTALASRVSTQPSAGPDGRAADVSDPSPGESATSRSSEPSRTPLRLTLLVAPSNDGALSLYRSLGFVVDDRLPEHFDGEPALRLVRAD
jgi:ribosomal protein S18 acetylase RimI-like enzyme